MTDDVQKNDVELDEIESAFAKSKPFATSSNRSAIIELATTLVPYALLWTCAVILLDMGSLFFLVPVVIGALFFIRIFLLFHDCLHANFFVDRRANEVCAYLLGLLFFVPSRYWTEEHLAHHATAQNLDRRGRGDVILLTVKEYLELSPMNRLAYRLLRTLPGLFVVEMIGRWQILYRLPSSGRSRAAARGIMFTNIGLIGVQGTICYLAGWQNYLIIFGLVYLIGGCLGVWLFVSQHDFEDSQWQNNSDWTLRRSPWAGSSFLDFPRWGHWMVNNVSYHHIHHLNPKIPGYNLAACHNSDPFFATAPTLTFCQAWQSWRCQLWDEEARKIVSIREAEKNYETNSRTLVSATKEGKNGHGLFDVLYDGTSIVDGPAAPKADDNPARARAHT